MQISGAVRFPPCEAPLNVTRVSVTVRDLTELDGTARIIARLDLPTVHVPPTGLDLPFTLTAELSEPARIYALRAHADIEGSGSVDVGDLVTTTAHMVRAIDKHQVLLSLEPVSG